MNDDQNEERHVLPQLAPAPQVAIVHQPAALAVVDETAQRLQEALAAAPTVPNTAPEDASFAHSDTLPCPPVEMGAEEEEDLEALDGMSEEMPPEGNEHSSDDGAEYSSDDGAEYSSDDGAEYLVAETLEDGTYGADGEALEDTTHGSDGGMVEDGADGSDGEMVEEQSDVGANVGDDECASAEMAANDAKGDCESSQGT